MKQMYMILCGINLVWLQLLGIAHGQEIHDGFNPAVNGSVRKVITLSTGHVLVGGSFTEVAPGYFQSYLAAFNNDGTLYSTFEPSLDAVVNDMVQQPDGKILVAGAFTEVNGNPKPYLVRLLLNGSVDETFNPVVTAPVRAIGLHPDGGIVIGGAFPSKLTQLHADGSHDNSFQASLDAQALVHDLLVMDNKRVVVAGEFIAVNGHAKSNLVRLQPNGDIDPAFNPAGDPNWPVWSLLKHSNNQVVAGGEFTMIGAQNQTALARFKSTGELDEVFEFDINGDVYTLSSEHGGGLILGGSFTTIDGQSAVRVGRISHLGNQVGFATGYHPDAAVTASTVLADGDIVIGGEFFNVGTQTRTHLARFNGLRGELDQDFQFTVSGGVVQTMTRLHTGNYLLAGSFSSINGLPTENIILLSPEGSQIENPQFASTNGSFFNSVLSVLEIDQEIFLGGDFTLVNGEPRQGLVKLLSNGSVSASFNCPVNGTVYALAHWNNHILVAGNFTEINGISRQNLALINRGCGVVTAFDVSVSGGVIRSIFVQPDQRILISGGFNAVNGFARSQMARLLMVGLQGLVEGFNPALDGGVNTMAYLPNGQIVIAGDFVTVAGQNRHGLALLNADGSLSSKLNLPLNPGGDIYSMATLANGRIMLAGNFTHINGISKNRMAMIRPNPFNAGNYQVVTDFTADANNAVRSLFPTQNGKVFMLGSFGIVNGQSRNGVARISQSSFARETFIANGNLVTWRQMGTAPLQTHAPLLDIRENGVLLINSQAMTFHDNQWQLSIDSSDFTDTPIDFSIKGSYQVGFNNNSSAHRHVMNHREDYSDLIFANGLQF